MYRSAFPDLHVEIEDQIAEEDKVVVHWVGSGTHEGKLMGVDPTSNRVSIAGMTVYRIAEGKIAETWDNYDATGMMQQLGAIPRLGGAIHGGRITPEEISGGEGSQISLRMR